MIIVHSQIVKYSYLLPAARRMCCFIWHLSVWLFVCLSAE